MSIVRHFFSLLKGDKSGHVFRGNQYSGGAVGGGAGRSSEADADDDESNAMTTRADVKSGIANGDIETGTGRKFEGYRKTRTPEVDDDVTVVGDVGGAGRVGRVTGASRDGSFLTVRYNKGGSASYHSTDLVANDILD